jgi:NAD+ kinase
MRQGKSLPRIVIFGDPARGPVAEAIRDFSQFLKDKAELVAICHISGCKAEILKDIDFAVVLGGDGTIISAARTLSEARVPVIGVNMGKLGFLAEFSAGEFKKWYSDIVSGKAPVEKRMILSCRVTDKSEGDAPRFRSKAINDVYITAGPPYHVVELNISVDGQHVASCVGDGLIVSTPSGSTAYNLSAGGPILAGAMEAMVITPICPHSLSFRPIVIGAANVVQITATRVNEGTTVSVDGQVSTGMTLRDVVTVSAERCSFLIVDNPMQTRWDTLATKLGWAKKPQYEVE